MDTFKKEQKGLLEPKTLEDSLEGLKSRSNRAGETMSRKTNLSKSP
jgi:hypothetical protein